MIRRRLGQHYLVDQTVVRMVLDKAAICPGERVLEIGTGKGALTEKLAEVSSTLEGYEIDDSNYKETLRRVGGRNVTVHLGDAFLRKPDFDVLVSSLPYSESAEFVEWISQVEYDRAVVILQKDFVQKLQSPPGNRDYRAVSAIAQISSEIELVGKIPRDAFSPPPKVDSVLVSLKPKKRMPPGQISELKRLFSLRRRVLSGALAELGLPGVARSLGARRVYSLTPDEICEICPPRRPG